MKHQSIGAGTNLLQAGLLSSHRVVMNACTDLTAWIGGHNGRCKDAMSSTMDAKQSITG